MQKTAILTLSLVLMGILPVAAQLGQVWTDFQSYSTDLQDYFQYNNLSDNLKPIESQSRDAINNANGVLNIPNPVAAGKNVRDNLINFSYNFDSRANRFENNAAVQGNLLSNELNRVITRGAVVGILGKNGQIRLKEKLQNTEESLKNIATDDSKIQTKINSLVSNAALVTSGIAGLAEVLGLTQSQSTQIQQEQAKIVAETFAQTVQTNEFLQYSNLNLANISQQAEEANRARRVETSTEAARLLRATSQIDLFGRKFDK
ncbi:hypothetical protein [Nostoc sp. C117]|uniref:hypothetical protein n=1 Tax=Nostoc sp. C117 TaxID=3349875 RepID=UPI00370D9E49